MIAAIRAWILRIRVRRAVLRDDWDEARRLNKLYALLRVKQ
jgi:hypothetical protein